MRGHLRARGCSTVRSTNLAYVPEQQTDFIFSAVGEQLGFVGAGVLLLALRGGGLAGAADGPAGPGQLRAAAVFGGLRPAGLLGLRERRDEHGDHAGGRHPPALPLLRRVVDRSSSSPPSGIDGQRARPERPVTDPVPGRWRPRPGSRPAQGRPVDGRPPRAGREHVDRGHAPPMPATRPMPGPGRGPVPDGAGVGGQRRPAQPAPDGGPPRDRVAAAPAVVLHRPAGRAWCSPTPSAGSRPPGRSPTSCSAGSSRASTSTWWRCAWSAARAPIYFAELDLRGRSGRSVHSCRPSDALTVALLQPVPVPILIDRRLFEGGDVDRWRRTADPVSTVARRR